MNNVSFGNCEKHPNFPMINCPGCEVDIIIDETESRIAAGEDVLEQCKKQMKILKGKRKAFQRIKNSPNYKHGN